MTLLFFKIHTGKLPVALKCVQCGSTVDVWFYVNLFICLKLPGKKDLFIEADLMSPLDRIANVTTLKVGLIQCHYVIRLKGHQILFIVFTF